jgi:hypothetical protein
MHFIRGFFAPAPTDAAMSAARAKVDDLIKKHKVRSGSRCLGGRKGPPPP